MKWKEFKKIVKELRKESNRLSRIHKEQIWCNFNLWLGKNKVIDVNPYCPNLTTGEYGIERNLITGKYLHNINIKKILEKNE